jgi:glycine cleavage system H protein
VVYPPMPPMPPGPPGTPGGQQLQEALQRQAQAAMAQRPAVRAADDRAKAVAAEPEQTADRRRELMGGRWFTPEHEWVAFGEQDVTVGISDYFADILGGRIVRVSLPVPGTTVSAGEPYGELESTEAIGGLRAPASGQVTEGNRLLDSDPDRARADPYGAGWLFRMRIGPGAGAGLRAALLTAAEYAELTGGLG